jgi:hypothetical protein
VGLKEGPAELRLQRKRKESGPGASQAADLPESREAGEAFAARTIVYR